MILRYMECCLLYCLHFTILANSAKIMFISFISSLLLANRVNLFVDWSQSLALSTFEYALPRYTMAFRLWVVCIGDAGTLPIRIEMGSSCNSLGPYCGRFLCRTDKVLCIFLPNKRHASPIQSPELQVRSVSYHTRCYACLLPLDDIGFVVF